MIVVTGGLIRQLREALITKEGAPFSRQKLCTEATLLGLSLEPHTLVYLETKRTRMALGDTLLAIAVTFRTVAGKNLQAIDDGSIKRPDKGKMDLLNRAASITVEQLMKRETEVVA